MVKFYFQTKQTNRDRQTERKRGLEKPLEALSVKFVTFV